jgi:hypothetical protein
MKRPVVVTVLGIINIVFAAWGLIGLAFSSVLLFSDVAAANNPVFKILHDQPAYLAFAKVSLVIGGLAAIVLLVAGIGLLLLRPWARPLTIGYAIFGMLNTVVGTVVNYLFLVRPLLDQAAHKNGPEAAGAIVGAIGGGFGGCLSLIYPILLLVFMARPEVKAAFRPTVLTAEPPDNW